MQALLIRSSISSRSLTQPKRQKQNLIGIPLRRSSGSHAAPPAPTFCRFRPCKHHSSDCVAVDHRASLAGLSGEDSTVLKKSAYWWAAWRPSMPGYAPRRTFIPIVQPGLTTGAGRRDSCPNSSRRVTGNGSAESAMPDLCCSPAVCWRGQPRSLRVALARYRLSTRCRTRRQSRLIS